MKHIHREQGYEAHPPQPVVAAAAPAASVSRPLPDDEQRRHRAPRWAGDSSVVLGAERRGIPLEELTQRAPNRHMSRARGDTSIDDPHVILPPLNSIHLY